MCFIHSDSSPITIMELENAIPYGCFSTTFIFSTHNKLPTMGSDATHYSYVRIEINIDVKISTTAIPLFSSCVPQLGANFEA